jgi:hypothetical protein
MVSARNLVKNLFLTLHVESFVMLLLLDALLKEKLVTSEQINGARDKQAGANKSIYEVLINIGFLRVRKFKIY